MNTYLYDSSIEIALKSALGFDCGILDNANHRKRENDFEEFRKWVWLQNANPRSLNCVAKLWLKYRLSML